MIFRKAFPLGLPLILLAAAAPAEEHVSFFADAVYLKRTGTSNRTLIEKSNQAHTEKHPISDAKTLAKNWDFEPGYRVGAAWMVDKRNSLEALYLQVTDWQEEDSFHKDGRLSFPFKGTGYGQYFDEANRASAEYGSKLYNGELNFWRHMTPRDEEYCSFSGLVGFRYIAINEKLHLNFIKASAKNDYDISTHNHLAGPQIGLNAQFYPTTKFFWELTAKIGGYFNQAKQSQSVKVLDGTAIFRDTSSKKSKVGMLAEASFDLGYRFSPHLLMHAGYTAFYLTTLALAPDQIDKRTSSSSGKHVNTDGDQVFQGLFAGLALMF